MDLSYLWIALALLFIGGKLWSMRRSPAQLAAIQAALDDGALLVDVRSPGEFASGHLPGARNIPVARIKQEAAALQASGKAVVVYCASGTRAGIAVAALKAAGVGPLFNLGTVGNGQQLRFPSAR